MATVLIVDDDIVMLRLISLALSSQDILVKTARGGAEALALLESAVPEPDLMVLDLMMPVMDGREVFRRVRNAGYDGPVIFCSAYGAEQANRELGAQGALQKPFDPDDLVAAVRSRLPE